MSDHKERFTGVEQSRTFRHLCDLFDLRTKAVLDIGCGYGQYLRIFGKGSVGITTADEEVQFGKKEDLAILFGNAEHLDPELGAHFKVVWANNIFEHLLSPHAFLMNLKKLTTPEAVIIIGVPVVPKIVSLVRLRWWRGMLASNHVNFFTSTTVGLTVERAGWTPVEVRPFIFKDRVFDLLVRPFAPHMYVVAKNNPDFKYPPKKLHEWEGDQYYKDMLTITHQEH